MPRITQTSLSNSFEEVVSKARAFGETNDCSVKAAAILCCIPYEEALITFEECGRLPKKPTPTQVTKDAYERLGFNLNYVPLRPILDSYPSPHHNMKNVTSHQPARFPEQWEPYSDGGYLLHSRTHALAMRNGIVHCWSVNSALRIIQMWKVEPK